MTGRGQLTAMTTDSPGDITSVFRQGPGLFMQLLTPYLQAASVVSLSLFFT